MRRRDLLVGLGAGAALWPARAWSFGPASEVDIAEIDLGGSTIARPDAWERLVFEIQQTTSVTVHASRARVAPTDPALFAHPIAAIVGSGEFPMPGDDGLEKLSRFLSYGGSLLFDETTGADRSGFDRSVRTLCDVLFPTRPLAPLPSDHSVYRSFFLIDRPVGRIARHGFMEGVTVDGKDGRGGWTPVMYTRNDLSGALERGMDGRHSASCEPGGETQRREAVKLGINIVLYALTTDYKKDQAHVKALMESNRLQGDWGEP